MPYWDVVTRSFVIAWRHKYLWLIALFSGESGGGSFSGNYNYSQPSSKPPNPQAIQEQTTTWINDHTGLLVALGVVLLLLVVAFFFLAAVCEGATVRASAEHDADRPFNLRQAWTMGVHTMWVIVRFRLLLLLFYLPLLALFAVWLIALVLAIAGSNVGAALGLGFGGLVLLLLVFVAALYLFFLDRLGSRAAILEERMALPAIGRAHRLLFKRLGRTLVVWLLAVAVAFVLAILLACFSALLVLPFILALAVSSASGAFWAILIPTLIVLVPAYFLVSAFLAAQGSTYWTVAFRRLDVDYPPPYRYPVAAR